MGAAAHAVTAGDWRNRWRRHAPDVAIAVALAVVAFLARRNGLPTDGLWLDDAITGAGLEASPSELLVVGADHPGFIALLAGWSSLTGGGDAALAYPALAAGTLGPPVLFLGLRWIGFARAVSVLLAAVVVASQTDIVYSGRVRTFTIDLLIVLAVVMLLPRLARLSWRPWTAVAWVGATLAVATFSIFATVAAAAAGVILALHPRGDLRARILAVGGQAVTTGALFAAERSTYDGAAHAEDVNEQWDTFISFDVNPIAFAEETLLHLRRLAETFSGNTEWLALVLALVALGGLAVAALRGQQALRARYLLLVVGIAFIGSLIQRFPFGPAEGNPFSDGRRWSIWLIPALVVGLAIALQAVRARLEVRPGLRTGFDLVAVAGAVAVLASAGPALPYPFSGADSAAEYVDRELGPEDALLIPYRAEWSFGAESGLDSTIEATPESTIGFVPGFPDPRITNLELTVGVEDLPASLREAERTLVYYPEPAFSEEEADARTTLAASLDELGFRAAAPAGFGDAVVEVWQRGGGEPDGSDTAGLWSPTASREAVNLPAVLECLGVPTGAASSGTAYEGPLGTGSSEVITWPSRSSAGNAFDALREDATAACLQEHLGTILEGLGFNGTVEVETVDPPAGVGPAVAFRQVTRSEPDGTRSDTSLVVLARGDATIMVSAAPIGEGGLPTEALVSLIAEIEADATAARNGG